jgi:hypothetical protein
MPAGLYRLQRDPTQKNPNPIVISPKVTKQTSEQMAQPLLCGECEERFSKNGESYVLRRLSNRVRFPLLDRLNVAWADYETPKLSMHRGEGVGLDMDKIAYFALSILWRASARPWKTLDGQTTQIVLDPKYQEILRQYLLGEIPLPNDIVVMATVATDKGSQESCFVPSRVKCNPMVAYGLMTKGLYFRVFFGDISEGMRQLCCVNGARKVIFKRDCEDNLMEGFGKLFETSVVKGTLSKS